jgi:hypothetical protein
LIREILEEIDEGLLSDLFGGLTEIQKVASALKKEGKKFASALEATKGNVSPEEFFSEFKKMIANAFAIVDSSSLDSRVKYSMKVGFASGLLGTIRKQMKDDEKVNKIVSMALSDYPSEFVQEIKKEVGL